MREYYVIVGDTENYKGCLVCTCGDKEYANEVLNRMLTNPDENDKKLIKGHSNLRVQAIEEDDCWWSQGSLD